MDVYSGFDKELELRVLARKIKIKYAEDILVFDEKVDDHAVFVNQRRRWIYAQLHFLRANFTNAVYMLVVKRNYDYANKVFQFMLLPRVIGIGFCGLLLVTTAFVNTALFEITSVVSIIMAVALFIPVQHKLFTATGLATLVELPKAFINMLFATITSGRASKKFLHTPHNTR